MPLNSFNKKAMNYLKQEVKDLNKRLSNASMEPVKRKYLIAMIIRKEKLIKQYERKLKKHDRV